MNSLSSNFDLGITTHTQRNTQTAKLRSQRPMNSAARSHEFHTMPAARCPGDMNTYF